MFSQKGCTPQNHICSAYRHNGANFRATRGQTQGYCEYRQNPDSHRSREPRYNPHNRRPLAAQEPTNLTTDQPLLGLLTCRTLRMSASLAAVAL